MKIGGTDLKHDSNLDLLMVLAVVYFYYLEGLRKLAVSIYIKCCSGSTFSSVFVAVALHTLGEYRDAYEMLRLSVFNFISRRTPCHSVQLSHCE